MTDKPLNPWVPERDPLALAVLGKLAEELGEASQMVARCIIQGIGESEPVTGKPNRHALEDEIADILATTTMAVEHFGLDLPRISDRRFKKIQHLTRWHGLIRAAQVEVRRG